MPHTPPLFDDLLMILLASVPVAFLCLRLRLPLLVGLMLTGIGIGPYGLGLIKETHDIELLAEIGVMLLLFTIGLEFSLKRLREMRRLVLVGGVLQVVLTAGLVAALAALLGRSSNQAIFFGFLIALSSTAIVLKSYVERREVDAPHGRVGVGILLFQDLSIVLMMLLLPLLGGQQSGSAAEVAGALGLSMAALAVLILGAWLLVPKILGQVARLRSPEVFVITVVLLCLGTAWLTAQLGLSLALGAFIAGMVLADSDYNHQVAAEVLPFRDVFNSLFFVSIGMLLSVGAMAANLSTVLILVVLLIAGKSLIVLAVVKFMGFPLRIAATAGLGLAQIGEFSFVLARAGRGEGLLPDADYQIFLAASIVSMILTPFLIAGAPRVGYALQNLATRKTVSAETNETEIESEAASDVADEHVIIVGYGLNGRNLARVLKAVGVPYKVLELNAELVNRAAERGEKIAFGDSTRREVLLHAGIEKALVLVVAISDSQAARRTVSQARQCSANLHIIVRTRYVSEITELLELGADEVIPEEFETSIEIFARVLQEYKVPRPVIERQIEEIRRQGYQVLRSTALAQGKIGNLNAAFGEATTETIALEADSPLVGKNLGELRLRNEAGVTVIAVVRDGQTKVNPGASYKLHPEDILVLLGSPQKIERAREILLPGDKTGGFNP